MKNVRYVFDDLTLFLCRFEAASAGCNHIDGHKTDDPSEWTVEHVQSWIAGQKDSNLSCLAELFLKHVSAAELMFKLVALNI